MVCGPAVGSYPWSAELTDAEKRYLLLVQNGCAGMPEMGRGQSAGKETQHSYGLHCRDGREGGGKDDFSRGQELVGEACTLPRF